MVKFEKTYCDILTGKLKADNHIKKTAFDHCLRMYEKIKEIVNECEFLRNDFNTYKIALLTHNIKR